MQSPRSVVERPVFSATPCIRNCTDKTRIYVALIYFCMEKFVQISPPFNQNVSNFFNTNKVVSTSAIIIFNHSNFIIGIMNGLAVYPSESS